MLADLATNLIAPSPLGLAVYRVTTDGAAGAAIAPLDFQPPPWAAARKR